MNHKNPGVAAVLSFVFSGLGQIYNGQIKKGLWLIFLATTGIILVLGGALPLAVSFYYGFFSWKLIVFGIVFLLLGGVLICWSGIYSIFDAYREASNVKSPELDPDT